MMHNSIFYGGGACPVFGGFWSGLIALGIFLVVFAGVLWLIKNRNSGSSAMFDELKMKLASGEIPEEEYLRKKEILERK